MRAQLDLSPALLRSLARGNPANLPRFMVHDDQNWPWGKVQLDAKQRIHMRRSDFYSTVVPELPVRAGIWLNAELQEFTVDLTADQLHGGAVVDRGRAKQSEYRAITADRRKCPECGGWMHDMHKVGLKFDTHSPGRFCLSCNYGTTSGDGPGLVTKADFQKFRRKWVQ